MTFEEKLEEMRERTEMWVRIQMDWQRQSEERWARYDEDRKREGRIRGPAANCRTGEG